MPLKTNKYRINECFAIIIILLANLSALAQETDTIIPIDKDPEKILRKIDIRKIAKDGLNFWPDKFTGHWAGIDFGFNMFLNEDYEGYDYDFMENDILRSNSTYINLVQQSISLQRNRNTIGLVTGLGMHFQSYRLDDNTTIKRLANDVIVPEKLYFDDNQKSKLSIFSINIPLLAEFQIPINHFDNRIYFSGGMYMGVRLTSHTKIKYRKEQKEKLKVPDHYSLQDVKYGLMFRTGYRWINFFATYEITPLFKKDKGPELTPFTFGVTLISF
ncbi:PorT family protein [Draconibacterium sp.]|nr:PorT family protein [Draconibacterium sp.]